MLRGGLCWVEENTTSSSLLCLSFSIYIFCLYDEGDSYIPTNDSLILSLIISVKRIWYVQQIIPIISTMHMRFPVLLPQNVVLKQKYSFNAQKSVIMQIKLEFLFLFRIIKDNWKEIILIWTKTQRFLRWGDCWFYYNS